MGRLRRFYTSLVVSATLLVADNYPLMTTPNVSVQTAIDYVIDETYTSSGNTNVRAVSNPPTEDDARLPIEQSRPLPTVNSDNTEPTQCDGDGYSLYPQKMVPEP